MRFIKAICLLPLCLSVTAHAKFAEFNYQNYSIQIDCEMKLANHVHYQLSGETKRAKGSYQQAPGLKSICQQQNYAKYRDKYHMGDFYTHKRIFDALPKNGNARAQSQANDIINTWPMAINLTEGSWDRLAQLETCYAKQEPVQVHAGLFPAEKPLDDTFAWSHGIHTPANYFKILVRGDKLVAYIFPNTQEPLAHKLSDYRVSVREIERRAGLLLPIDDGLKDGTLPGAWVKPSGC